MAPPLHPEIPQKVSNYVTLTSTPQRRAGGFLAARLRDKGWSIRDAADYLGVSRQRLYTAFDDPNRARLWECAIQGMPACTAVLKGELKALRLKKPRPAPRVTLQAPAFEVGDEVVVTKYAGIAEEDEAGFIAGLRGAKDQQEILVSMPGGEDWFPLADFHAHFATTGLNRNQ